MLTGLDDEDVGRRDVDVRDELEALEVIDSDGIVFDEAAVLEPDEPAVSATTSVTVSTTTPASTPATIAPVCFFRGAGGRGGYGPHCGGGGQWPGGGWLIAGCSPGGSGTPGAVGGAPSSIGGRRRRTVRIGEIRYRRPAGRPRRPAPRSPS
ncbi:hypothetical protein GCM10023214_69350 [Amycolatopsis dongchuanensis]|uniref:Uncharacterized protein n=1 Tax=Amycolatopsis dongchuanensis TaxID=1070866 RepID=A0ABP8VL78_9PSEU